MPKEPDILSDKEIWDLLQGFVDDLHMVHGDTAAGDTAISTVRTVLIGLQMTLLHKMEGIDPPKRKPGDLQAVTVHLIPEMLQSLRAYALDKHPDKDLPLVLSFIIGQQMAMAGYFDPNEIK